MELTNLEREVNPTTQQRGSPSLICQRIAQKSRSADFAGRHAGFATASRMHTEWKRLPRHLHLSTSGIECRLLEKRLAQCSAILLASLAQPDLGKKSIRTRFFNGRASRVSDLIAELLTPSLIIPRKVTLNVVAARFYTCLQSHLYNAEFAAIRGV
jgi:hypothetical protein